MGFYLVPVLIVALAAPSPAKVAAPSPKWPSEVVRALFTDHLKHEMGFTKASVARKSRWLSPEFMALLNAELARPGNPDMAPNINGDPFTDSQEYPSRFVVGKAEIAGDVTRIPVTFTGNGRRRTVAVRLRKSPDGWLVDDLIYEDGRTLRGLLGK